MYNISCLLGLRLGLGWQQMRARFIGIKYGHPHEWFASSNRQQQKCIYTKNIVMYNKHLKISMSYGCTYMPECMCVQSKHNIQSEEEDYEYEKKTSYARTFTLLIRRAFYNTFGGI